MGLSETHGKICLGNKSPVILPEEITSLAYLPSSFGELNVDRVFV
jgi:hypothetical protein